MAKLELPPAELLRKLLRYELKTGFLYWQPRPRDMFTTAQPWSAWNTRFAGCRAFTALAADGYFVGRLGGKNYRAHRVIWKLVHGVDPDQVDHVNGIPTDNRLANLRDVSKTTNARNAGRPITNTSGTVGVCARRGRWMAYIHINERRIYLGDFANLEDAVSARKAAEQANGFHANHGSDRVSARQKRLRATGSPGRRPDSP